MFTGIIEEIGRIRSIKKGNEWCQLVIEAHEILRDVKLGDSIAVNGVCLTVTQFTPSTFSADVMPETLKKTSLSILRNSSPVNLERAMGTGGRFGGHFVSGHVDGVGTIQKKTPFGNAILFEIAAPPELLYYMIPKGSIAVDGISLTIIDVNEKTFTLSIIPHTLEKTILQYKDAGDPVNLENDMIGKYIAKFVNRQLAGKQQGKEEERITMSLLSQHGFI